MTTNANSMEASTSVMGTIYDNTHTEQPETPIPDGFYEQIIAFHQFEVVLLIFVLAVSLLRFGNDLWRSFADKWGD